ncbi:hypothetical protein SOVF_084350 [Spinacia oleracea]|nr:hypothetical protein SOVF_084350 [Spinacia oleracea]
MSSPPKMIEKILNSTYMYHLSFILPFLLFIVFLCKWLSTTIQNLPPSPPRWPILGHLHKLGMSPHRYLRSLSERYGDLMLIYLGNKPTIIVSSARVAKEIMKTHDASVSSRLKLSIYNKLLYNCSDVAGSPYGEYWRQMKSIFVLHLLSSRRVRSFRDVREEETALLMEKIQQNNGSVVNLSELFANMTYDVICRVAFGGKHSGNQQSGADVKEVLKEFEELIGLFNVGDFIPWLAWVNRFNGINKRLEKVSKGIDLILEAILAEHEHLDRHNQAGNRGDGKDENKGKDFVDVLLEVQKENSAGFHLERESIKGLILFQNLPPSPPKLPILGHLHRLGIHPHRSLRSLSDRCGKLMMIYLGNRPTLIISSAEVAQEIMKTHDSVFSNRPKFSIYDKLLYNSRDVSASPYGEYWRQMKSICVLQLLSDRRVRSFRDIRNEETALLMQKIQKSNASVVNLSEMFVVLTNDVVCRVAFGRKYSENQESDIDFKEVLKEFVELLGVFNVGDFIPWLAWVNRFNGMDARLEKVAKRFDLLLEGILKEHSDRHNQTKNSNENENEAKDFVDVLLQVQKENSAGFSLERDSIKALILFLKNFGFHPLSLPFILFLIFLYKWLNKKPAKTRKLPPSPRKLPILGNLHQLGQFLNRSLYSLSKQYGEVMLIYIGNTPSIVISSASAAREVMKTHDVIFSNRPRSRIVNKIIYDGKDLAFSPYGEFWRQIRSICVLQLLSTKKVQSFRKVREEEVDLVVQMIKRSEHCPVNLSETFVMFSTNILCRTAFGKKYVGEVGTNFKQLLKDYVEVIGKFSMGDIIPWLGWIDRLSGLERRVDKVAREFDDFLQHVVQEHLDRKTEKEENDKDFVDILLDAQKENPAALQMDSIKAIVLVSNPPRPSNHT